MLQSYTNTYFLQFFVEKILYDDYYSGDCVLFCISLTIIPAIINPKIAVMWAMVPFICAFELHHS